MGDPWPAGAAGVLELPSGRRVRGRGLPGRGGGPARAGRREDPAGPPPEFGLYLLGRRPADLPWESRWVRWRDFGLPADPTAFRTALREAWERAADQRVELACGGGTGRTGTALACLAVLDGVPAREAVALVRAGYRARAVETPWQRAFVTRFLP